MNIAYLKDFVTFKSTMEGKGKTRKICDQYSTFNVCYDFQNLLKDIFYI